jgi:hypothetical protein
MKTTLMNFKLLCLLAFLLVVIAIAGCGGGGGGGIGGTGAPMGTLNVSVTDAPACGFDQVNVTIERVRVHQSPSADESDSGWQEIVVNPPRRVDLLSLTNGVLENLGQVELPSGRYTQIRLVLAENRPGNLFANSVVPTGGSEVALQTPSGQQSGLKLNVNIDVPAGQVLDVALDFDACKSVVPRGNSGQYNLKPVLRVLPVLADAGLRVTGYVDAALAAAGTQVSAQVNGVPARATVAAADGRFALTQLPVGTYDIVFTAAGRTTAVVTGVPVVSGTPTVLSSTAQPITLPVSSTRPVTGTVAPATGTVRALQLLSGGPTVDVGWLAVNAVGGAFSADLPVAAPLRAAWPTTAGTALSFAPDTAVAGRYTLEAASGTAVQTRDVNISTTTPAPVSFVFP